MRKIWRRVKIVEEKRFRANEQIRVPEVFLIDENSVRVGVMTIQKALALAAEAGLDLVEVSPVEQPPVVKIMDYGQFKYEKEKKAHKQKVSQKKVDTKVIRLSVRIGKHDLKVREDQAINFLEKGHKLKVELLLRGREKQHPQIAEDLIKEFTQNIENNEEMHIIKEQDLTKQGGMYTIILVNKKD
jgi:translation initiation factor IF-3